MDAVASRALADLVLALHAAFVAFVVLGLVAILVGGALQWRWVRDPCFRALHLAAIGVVVAEAWAGVTCPLTSLEDSLRAAAGEATYSGAFVAHWLGRLLYWQAPRWVFVTAYTIFGTAVVASWWLVRPRPFRASLEASARHGSDTARPARAPDGP
jgi:hypothetical protein